MTDVDQIPVCAILGAGVGTGAALARRFAKAGYRVAVVARSTLVIDALASEIGENASAFVCDVTDPDAIAATLGKIAETLGSIDVLCYNAGSGVRGTLEEISLEIFEQSWRTNTLGLLAASKAVIPAMKAKEKGTIIITGATASRRGAAFTAAFAPAKAAQRSLAESMAKHLGPLGIHVALMIVDGAIDLPKTRTMLKDKPDDFFIAPSDLAETAFWLAHQAKSAWSFEVEARPFGEPW
jgi:NAD(P)-dependent dehydrogenase (short-subunit alcohol dehydrogenase family)